MAALTTRTLVLGIASMFQPANGYQLRRELLSWNVQNWANVNPGSIYSMLTTLTKQGMLQAHTLPDGERAVTVYTTTDAGEAELVSLIHHGIVNVSAMDPTLFRVAIGFVPMLTRENFLAWLKERLTVVQSGAAGLESEAAKILESLSAPPHVGYSLGLEGKLLGAEAEWLSDLIGIVEGGGLYFMGEPNGWTPPPDDAGWEMAGEIARYREQLSRGEDANQ